MAVTDTPNAQQFLLASIPSPSAPIMSPSGLPMSTPSATAAPILHWMDGDLAKAWVREAVRVATVATPAATGPAFLDPPAVYMDDNGVEWGPIYRCLYAIMQVYNALNIPWFIDPEARKLWRKYIAGLPAGHGESTALAEFGRQDYNSDFLSDSGNNPQWVRWGGSNRSRAGVISNQMQLLMAATSQFRTTAYDSIAQTPSIWPYLHIPTSLNVEVEPDQNPSYYPVVENTLTTVLLRPDGFVQAWGGFVDERLLNGDHFNPDVNILSIPSGSLKSVLDPGHDVSNQIYNEGSGIGGGNSRLYCPGVGVGLYCNGARDRLTAVPIDWRHYTVDHPMIGYDRTGVPPIYYMPWLAEWAASLSSRASQDIVVAARVYATYANAMGASPSAYGGVDSFFRQAGLSDASLLTQETAPNSQEQLAIHATAQIVGAVGGALAVPTSGISVVAGALIAGALLIASTQMRTPTTGHRDDLGRIKPVVERGWLAGDVSQSNSNGVPPLNVPAPAGWTRPLVLTVPESVRRLHLHPEGYGVLAGPFPASTSRGPNWLLVAFLAALGYGGYRLLAPSPARRRNPRRRTLHRTRRSLR